MPFCKCLSLFYSREPCANQCYGFTFLRALLDMALVEEGPDMEMEVKKKEDHVYRIQLRLFEAQLRLLEEEVRKLKLEEKYSEGSELEAIRKRLEYLPSKMAKLRLKMVKFYCGCGFQTLIAQSAVLSVGGCVYNIVLLSCANSKRAKPNLLTPRRG